MVTFSKPSLFASTAALSALAGGVAAFDMSRNDNVVAYWGQNSYGAANGQDTANFQKSLGEYCDDDSIDTFAISFLTVFFGPGGLPQMDLANTCSTVTQKPFGDSQLPDCSFLAEDIKKCQAKGKIVTLSMGGATGGSTFTDDKQASDFADQIWNLFLGGTSDTRPFGDAVLDGVDLDIEGGGSKTFASFVTQLRTHFDSSKSYYVTAAPQCVFPDANLGETLSSAEFDAIYVQFYNNYCGVQNYDNPTAWNFAQWDDFAKNQSPNKDVKIYVGVPASSTAAGSGYVEAAKVGEIAKATASQYSSFGGVMFWDASQARANNRFDQAVKAAISNGTPPSGPAPPSSTDAPAPPSSTDAPAPPSSTDAPVPPVSSDPAPVPSSTEAPIPPVSSDPVPPSSTEAPVPPVSSAPVPVPSSSTEAPIPTSDPGSGGGEGPGTTDDPCETEVPAPTSTDSVPVPPSSTEAPIPPSSTAAPVPPSSTEAPVPPSSTEAPVPPSSTEAPTPTDGGDDCDPAPTSAPSDPSTGGSAGGSEWDASTAYTGGTCVTYNGASYTAAWWTQGETPGTAAVWTAGCGSAPTKRWMTPESEKPRSGGILGYRRSGVSAAGSNRDHLLRRSHLMRRSRIGPARLH